MADTPGAVYTNSMHIPGKLGRPGFSLIELLVVITIIIVLTMLAFVSYRRSSSNAKLSATATELQQIATSVTQYAQDNNGYPADVSRSVPPGLEPYLEGGVWPTGPWPSGVFDWDNWTHPTNGQQIYQVTYRLCDLDDPIASCADPVLFPDFGRNSSIFYCISGPCIPHSSSPTVPGYCVNCTPRKQNY
jgi:prepilin-type N-terminal cleavage/methylation domain-containing protein